ncbi:MAG: cytochrome bc1 complex diheme cytochrome c subunit [Actinomycetota bacterium]
MKRAVALSALIAIASLYAACDYFEGETNPTRVTPDTSEQLATASGGELYSRDCGWCHGNDGEGTARGPDLVSGENGPAFTDFMLATGRMPIDDPDERAERHEPVYNDQQIAAIVDYVADFGADGPDIPEVHPEEGDLGEGLELYQENCAACHAPTLIGAPLTRGRAGSRSIIAPGLRAATSTEITEAMLVGPGAMPVFSEDTFTESQFDSIVAYVIEQQDPNDRGGAPIGHVGPVAEGAVAWIIGLGAMLLLIRWIGTKIGEV